MPFSGTTCCSSVGALQDTTPGGELCITQSQQLDTGAQESNMSLMTNKLRMCRHALFASWPSVYSGRETIPHPEPIFHALRAVRNELLEKISHHQSTHDHEYSLVAVCCNYSTDLSHQNPHAVMTHSCCSCREHSGG